MTTLYKVLSGIMYVTGPLGTLILVLAIGTNEGAGLGMSLIGIATLAWFVQACITQDRINRNQ